MTEPLQTLRLEIRSVDRLLDVEGSPLVGPRIHPEVAQTIYHDAEEFRGKQRFRIEICVPQDDVARTAEVEAAIHKHFSNQERDAISELRDTLGNGRISLFIALLVVAALVLISEWLQYFGQGRLHTLLGESLIILAWVTLWMPAEMLLFEHLPIRRKRHISHALARSQIVLVDGQRHPEKDPH